MSRRLFLTTLLVLLAATCFWVARTIAQGGSSNDVTLTFATAGTGQILAGGTYTVASGYTLVGITIDARPAGDVAGEGGEQAAMIMNGFGAAVFVPVGQYNVQAILTVNDPGGTAHNFYSNVLTVTVSQ